MKTLQDFRQTARHRMGCYVRLMRAEDIPQVADIERECFPTGWAPTPFRRELQSRTARYLVACRAFDPLRAELEARRPVSEAQPESDREAGSIMAAIRKLLGSKPGEPRDVQPYVAGYAGLWFITDEAHLTAIGVRAIDRRHGIGELLLIASIELSIRRMSRVVTLETRVSNYGAQALYLKYGFNRVGVRKGYYTDNREDALIMTTNPIHSPAYRERFNDLVAAHERRWGVSIRIVD